VLITRTPVRISFVGGGTDQPEFYLQHGGAVISAAINKYFYTVLTKREDDVVQVISSDLRVMEEVDRIRVEAYEGDLRIPMAVMKHLGLRQGVTLFLASEIPPGTGLGSSAAVCVNVIRALWEMEGRPHSRYELAEEAYRVAREILKAPVGKQDEYAASFGGINEIRFAANGVHVAPLPLDDDVIGALEQRILLFFTGSQRNSYDILAEQCRRSEEGDHEVLAALQALRELVAEAREALTRADLDHFGEILDVGWEQKKRISRQISSPVVDLAYDEAKRRGALGGKLAGAGGGGFFMLVTREGCRDAVREVLASRGMKEMSFHFDLHGSRVVYNDPFFDSNGRGGTRWRFVPGI
jgi:D-glycero-alpha-D-manno-heptose-7-phosphate kinase